LGKKSILVSTIALAFTVIVIAIISSTYVSQASNDEADEAKQAVGDVPTTGKKGEMQCVMVMPPPGTDPEDLPTPESSGAKLTARYCAQCHDLPSPKMHNANNWPETAMRMFARMTITSNRMKSAGMPTRMETPSEKDQKTILAYLQENSLKTMTVDKLPMPESHGAVLFRKACTQCHDLPDMKLYVAEEWPGVIERMRYNMGEMEKRVITDSEAEVIGKYLAGNEV